MHCTAVTAPGFGGKERINRPECMSNIRALVSSQPTIARWPSVAKHIPRTCMNGFRFSRFAGEEVMTAKTKE